MTTQESTNKNYVGQEIARLRRDRDLSQAELLEALRPYGISWSRPLISWVETGKRSLRVEELTAIAAFFDVPVSSLLEG